MQGLKAECMCRVGDPSKEMSEEFVITLKTSLAPNKKYTYPLVYAPMTTAPCEKPVVTAFHFRAWHAIL